MRHVKKCLYNIAFFVLLMVTFQHSFKCVNVYVLYLCELKYTVSVFLQGKEIIEFYLNQLEEEGITHVPRWVPPTPTTTSQLTVSSSRPIPACSSRTHSNSTDVPPGSPDGEMNHCFPLSHAHKYNKSG